MDVQAAKEQAVKTGTTTVGLVCKEGVVLASDRRATMGYLIASKDIDKIYAIDEHIAMTIAGSVGDAQQLVRWMQAELRLYRLRHGKKATVQAASTLLANILAGYKYYPFWVQILVGGLDENGAGHVYSVDMLGGVTEDKMTSTGSGSPVAYGVLEELYKEDSPIIENVKIAAKAIGAAMRRDAASGERVDIIYINKDGFTRMPKDEVKKISSS